MIESDTFLLRDGARMPRLGLGTWQVPNDKAASLVTRALAEGYRLFDTAAAYGNEEGVGAGVREAGVARSDLFVTTKLANGRHGYDEALRAFDESLKRLGLEYVDLYLIHWPCPTIARYAEAWRALVRLTEEGRSRSIGVSNFTAAHIEVLKAETGVLPSLNQVELHLRLHQKQLRDFHARNQIVTQSWSPLGRGTVDDNPVIHDIARKHGKTWAQVILRWHLDNGLSVIPRTTTQARLRENIDIFDFSLDAEDIAIMRTLDAKQGRFGPDPETYCAPE